MIGSPKTFAASLLQWYRKNRRDLPWRPPVGAAPDVRPDPYHVLVSELMLQQTQVATVVPYFHRFLQRWPTVADLAAADEQEVLRQWQGLGYYSRARNLHRAAKAVTTSFGGIIPRTVEHLLELPGIGRYTAGAIASLAFGQPAAILDGNVQRVLCRLDAICTDPRERSTNARLWLRAAEIIPKENASDFNSGLMELGARICTPRNPQCDACPVRPSCQAARQGTQTDIPPAKKAIHRPIEKREVYCIHHDGRWLIQQRPAKGRWAAMWQFITLRPDEQPPVKLRHRQELGTIRHDLTHRRYEFRAWLCRPAGKVQTPQGWKWVTLEELAAYPLSRPQLQIAQLLLDPSVTEH